MVEGRSKRDRENSGERNKMVEVEKGTSRNVRQLLGAGRHHQRGTGRDLPGTHRGDQRAGALASNAVRAINQKARPKQGAEDTERQRPHGSVDRYSDGCSRDNIDWGQTTPRARWRGRVVKRRGSAASLMVTKLKKGRAVILGKDEAPSSHSSPTGHARRYRSRAGRCSIRLKTVSQTPSGSSYGPRRVSGGRVRAPFQRDRRHGDVRLDLARLRNSDVGIKPTIGLFQPHRHRADRGPDRTTRQIQTPQQRP